MTSNLLHIFEGTNGCFAYTKRYSLKPTQLLDVPIKCECSMHMHQAILSADCDYIYCFVHFFLQIAMINLSIYLTVGRVQICNLSNSLQWKTYQPIYSISKRAVHQLFYCIVNCSINSHRKNFWTFFSAIPNHFEYFLQHLGFRLSRLYFYELDFERQLKAN